MRLVVTAVADRFKIVFIKTKVRPHLIRYDVMDLSRRLYLCADACFQFLSTLLALVMITHHDPLRHLAPCLRVIEAQLLFSCHKQMRALVRPAVT